MSSLYLTFVVAALLLLLGEYSSTAASYKILGLFPFHGPSHHFAYDALMVELARRGHQVTVYNTFAKESVVPNYTRVDLRACFPLPDVLTIEQMAQLGHNKWHFIGDALFQFMPTVEQLANCAPLLHLWNLTSPDDETRHYDLMVTETFTADFWLLFAHKLRIPVIAFHPCPPLPWIRDAVSAPDHAGYMPHAGFGLVAPFNFAQRLENLILGTYSRLTYIFKSERFWDAQIPHIFGPDLPSIGYLTRHIDMLFLYEHFSINGASPTVPPVVDLAGLNIKPAGPLPQNIRQFIDESKDGVVYFCMGSLLRGKSFLKEKRDAFLYAFSKIPQRVLWKWEGDELPGKSDDIMISKWMPQRNILAHPNVKLFISHSGLLGTSEAVYEGVPILGIPIFGDQRNNIRNIEANGAGELLDYDDISNQTVLQKIQTILTNPEYQRKAKQLSKRYRDRPMSPLDTAVYWTEYVIRHKGTPFLRTSAVDMPWYQYLLFDVLAFLIAVFIIGLLLLYYVCKMSLALVAQLRRRALVTSKQRHS